MFLSAVSVLVVAQSSSEIPEGLMNNPVFQYVKENLLCLLYCEKANVARSKMDMLKEGNIKNE